MPDYQHITCVMVPAPEGSAGPPPAYAHVTFPQARFDGNAVRELFEFSNEIPPHHARLLVDCGDLELVPSGAMGMLVTIRKRFLSHGGQLHIAVPDPRIRGAFHAARMQLILQLFDSTSQAIAAFKR